MDATNAVAAKFPDVKFEHDTGYKRDTPNVSTYNARFYEEMCIRDRSCGAAKWLAPARRVTAPRARWRK